MLVKLAYPQNGFSFADFKADIAAIITGGVTTVNDLSASASKTDSEVIGTHTSGLFTLEDAATHTFSKTHHLHATQKSYFRLGYTDATDTLSQLHIAQDYISGTNTLVNVGEVASDNIVSMTYIPGEDYVPAKVFVITTKYGFYITSIVKSLVQYLGAMPGFGVFDISETGLMKLESEMSRHVSVQSTPYGKVRSPWYLTAGHSDVSYTKAYATREIYTGPLLYNNSRYTIYDQELADGSWQIYEQPYHHQEVYQALDTWTVYGINYIGSAQHARAPLGQFGTYTGGDGSIRMVFNQFGSRSANQPTGLGSQTTGLEKISIIIEE